MYRISSMQQKLENSLSKWKLVGVIPYVHKRICCFHVDTENQITPCSELNRICTGIEQEIPRCDVTKEVFPIPLAVYVHITSKLYLVRQSQCINAYFQGYTDPCMWLISLLSHVTITILSLPCRNPIPDYYSITLEISRDRTTMAQNVVCDSKNSKTMKCPPGYSDGDVFLHRTLNDACRKMVRVLSPVITHSELSSRESTSMLDYDYLVVNWCVLL